MVIQSAVDTAALLEELRILPSEQRSSRLKQTAVDLDDLLIKLGDETERLIGVELSRAASAATLVMELCDRIGSARSQARARRVLGQILAYRGEHRRAIETAQESIALADEADDAVLAARSRLGLIHPCTELGEYDKAIDAGEQARAIFIDSGRADLAARADFNLGVTWQNKGDPLRALKHFDTARDPLRSEPPIFAQLESNRGEALLALDRFPEARDAFASALATFERARMSWAAAITDGNLADLAAREGRLHEALRHFEHARRHIEADPSPTHLARVLVEQGDAKSILGMPREALSDYDAALPVLQGHDQKAEVARALSGTARTRLRLGKLAEAYQALDAAVEVYREIGNTTEATRLELLRADLLMCEGRFDESLSVSEIGIEALSDRPIDQAQAYRSAAAAALHLRQLERAHRFVACGIELAARSSVSGLTADLLIIRGRTAEARGDDESARRDYRTAIEHIERDRGLLQSNRLRAAFLGDRLDAYEHLVTSLLAQRSQSARAEAFAVLEQSRGRTLRERMIGHTEGHVPGDDESTDLSARQEQLVARLNALYSRLVDASVQDVARIADSIREAESALADVEFRLDATASGKAALTARITLEQVQQALEPGEAVLEYFIARGNVGAFIVKSDSIDAFTDLAPASELRDDIDRIDFQMQRGLRTSSKQHTERLRESANRALERLGVRLLGFLGDHLATLDRLIIVPHGILHSVPFASLRVGGRHLVEYTDVSTAPIASFILRDTRRFEANGRAVIIGAYDDMAPEIHAEALAVSGSVDRAVLLIGSDATSDALRQCCTDASLVHLACHGRFDPLVPQSSALRLADRWVPIRDIESWRLRAELLVLSACESGRSAVGSGDELAGLVSAFFIAGARSMIVALWRIDDAITTRFMTELYQAWQQNRDQQNLASILSSLQRRLIRENAHPAHWAPFLLIGD